MSILIETAEVEVGDVMDDILSKISASLVNGTEILEDEEMKEAKKEDSSNDDSLDEKQILTEGDKENISRTLKRMSRKELEDMVLVKVVEGIVKHSQAGQMRTKVLELQSQKDKMFQRVGHLQKQVQEMSRALKVLIENHNRDPNNLNPGKKRAPPLKFFRSVGLQVAWDPPFRAAITKVVHVSDNPTNGFKPIVNGNGATIFSNNNTQTVGLKRIPKPGTEHVEPQIVTSPHIARILSQNQSAKGNPTQNVLVNAQSVKKSVLLNNSNIVSSTTNVLSKPNVVPAIVDLTDDSVPASTTTTVIANGLPYQLINTSSGASSRVQLLQTSQGGYQLVSTPQQPGQGTRPVYFAQAINQQQQQGKPMQAVVFRNVSPKPTGTSVSQSSPSITSFRPQGSSQAPPPRVAATIGMNTLVRAPNQPLTPRKVQLPTLPAPAIVAIPRGKALKDAPPKPTLSLNEQTDGIVLSWALTLTAQNAEIASYQIYACQESLTSIPGKISQWKKVGDVRALPLPMACTLSQFTQGNRYFFIVRGVDTNGRTGPFCDPSPIILQKKS